MQIVAVVSFLLVTTVVLSSRDQCFNCNGVSDQKDCNVITSCGENEACYVRKFTQYNGKPLFESGCISKQNCQIIHQVSGLGRKRDDGITNCYECCTTGNGTYPCNDNLCGNPPATEKRCYSCSDTINPEDCENVVSCDQDSMCHTGTYIHPLSREIRYTLGCLGKTTCTALMNHWHSYQTSSQSSGHITLQHCNDCCNTDFCNIRLCGIPKRVKPVFIQKPDNSTLRPEFEGVILVCKTDPTSNATLHWEFKGLSGGTTISSQAREISVPNNVNLTIFPVHQSDMGEYICSATNSVGTSTTSAFLSPK
ncbi:uncharacterized protein LOC125661728 [Ostrea edulis]|uniref:uncharacterized protein LOC125661728 n=1 Tax=Ostrea edulis TaxID=37623 RepID=UPI0024AEEFEB|nr:uncharacterized protein LOC125661728 [Ostrea edulis]XP_056002169.1 uncharacterized protein LOC125661728 [Ostrea edulis]XP_056002171.1 uncharacterized protein LOC125661728 [Ostrea edulis]XP_056002172.1 uncharacterized protein LOC125661728 [Ostrea edulis]